jgi:hypothetical protein
MWCRDDKNGTISSQFTVFYSAFYHFNSLGTQPVFYPAGPKTKLTNN